MTEEVKQEQTNADAQLTINDLAVMKNIIDLASQRGAFKPNEMTIVGQTYSKLVGFLETVNQQKEEQKEATEVVEEAAAPVSTTKQKKRQRTAGEAQ